MTTHARRTVRYDEIAKGGFRFTSTDLYYWHDGIKNLRHLVPVGQGDWAKEDVSGTSVLSFPFDAGTSRIPAEINPTAFGTHKLRKRIAVPRDFGIFAPTSPITIAVWRADTVTSIKATLYSGPTPDPTINGADINPPVAGTWTVVELVPTGDYLAANFMTLEIEYVADTNGHLVWVGDLVMSYKTNRGNV